MTVNPDKDTHERAKAALPETLKALRVANAAALKAVRAGDFDGDLGADDRAWVEDINEQIKLHLDATYPGHPEAHDGGGRPSTWAEVEREAEQIDKRLAKLIKDLA